MTSVNVELEAVKDKIRALSRKTVQAGCTEAEAEAAMNLVGKLLDRFDLSMNEVVIDEEKCSTHYWAWGRVSKPDFHYCWTEIAALCNCHRHWNSIENRSYAFFGFESDGLLGIYLCNIINSAMKAGLENFKKTDPNYLNPNGLSRKSLSTAYTRGMTDRMRKKLRMTRLRIEKEKIERNSNQPKLDDKTSTELVHLKNAKVDREYKKLGMKLSYTRTKRTPTRSKIAFLAGRKTADSVNLSRPVENKSRPAAAFLS